MKTKQPCSPEAPRVRRGPACSITGRKVLPLFALSVLLAFAALFAGCTTEPGGANAATISPLNGTVTKVEVIHFTAPNQCYSCVVLGDYAEETVKTHFPEELGSGKIIFDHIDVADPEKKEIVERYGATGSSLWIGTYDDQGGFYKEQDIRVWYKLNDKPGFMQYLKTLIGMRLAGDFSQ
ncbi:MULTISPECIES: nitrophenyl compound nitroreductase subunit ArsF family protein [unclassified Methanoculleus]|uniref:nitrophenyl compound nitroreductase subunit ArsF family protein n=1 Tax=unclassified Methanoculleus TaxID=2619537 RepID=UPI0025F1E86D|nr:MULTISPECIES: nitrophenyl compound nitroreductase subunit ArsF family protein [unclassified Methanoculleus]